jgi:predicted phage-related endonuclease
MMIERRPITDREQWLAWRREDVTASAVAALFGCHPYLSALKLYLEKCGIAFPDNDNAIFRRGRRMEPGVAIAVAEERPQWTIRPAREYLRAPDIRLGASPDFYIDGDARGLGVLQAKSAAPSVYDREWGDGPPFWIALQTLAECILSNAAFGVAAALRIDAYDMDCSIHEIPRHPDAEARILTAITQFWDDVENGREPDPDYGKDADLLKIIAPRETASDAAIDLSGNNELPELLAERALLLARRNQDKARCEEIETEIKFLMRDAAIISGLPDWRISWKTEPRKGYTVAPSTPRVLRIVDKRIKETL